LGTGQTGVTGNVLLVLLARSPKTFTHGQDVHPGMVIPTPLWSQGWDGDNKDPRGKKPPRSQGTPGGAMANGGQCRAERIRNAKNIPLVISDPFFGINDETNLKNRPASPCASEFGIGL
jgi:hypothetical protein